MTMKLKDMTMYREAVPIEGWRSGGKALIQSLISGSESDAIPMLHQSSLARKAFFNHTYNLDPSTNFGPLGGQVKVDVYYLPATDTEYKKGEVLSRAVGLLASRARLLVRTENDEVSFYTCAHPYGKPGVQSGEYVNARPIDPAALVRNG